MLKMPFKRFIAGFTLIELIVTVSLIAIVSSIGFATYSNAQMLGRDQKRKQDLRAIASALALYKQVNGKYPCTDFQTSSGDSPGFWIRDYVLPQYLPGGYPCTNTNQVLDERYISAMPKDPINTGGIAFYDPTGYIYTYRSYECNIDGQWFILVANLENHNDPDRVSVKRPKLCNGADVYQNWVSHDWAFVITAP